MPKVIVVGAGVSGLATATFLDHPDTELVVLEAQDSPGGNVRTDREDGRILDRAANGWLSGEPAMDELIQLAGLQDRILPASHRSATRWIYADQGLHPAPLTPPALMRTELVPWWAKLRLLLEPFVGRGAGGRDETVAEFVRRRLGPAFLDRMVAPMVAGVFAADPERLSLAAAFPRMAALEDKHRSLILAALRLRRGGAPRGHLHSLDGGVGTLTDTLAARLGDRLQCGVRVDGVEHRRDRWMVHTAKGAMEADAVVLATPAHAQAAMVRGLDAGAAEALDHIPYAPVAVVITASPAGAWDRTPDGFGVLLARGERMGGVLGTLFTSCIFPDQARESETLLRTIVGGDLCPEAATMGHDQLLAWTRRAHTHFFGTERSPPHMVRIYQHLQGIPQYRPGHRARVRTVRAAEARLPGLFFTGNHLGGVAVKDCARAGQKTARGVRATLDLDHT